MRKYFRKHWQKKKPKNSHTRIITFHTTFRKILRFFTLKCFLSYCVKLSRRQKCLLEFAFMCNLCFFLINLYLFTYFEFTLYICKPLWKACISFLYFTWSAWEQETVLTNKGRDHAKLEYKRVYRQVFKKEACLVTRYMNEDIPGVPSPVGQYVLTKMYFSCKWFL